MNQYSVFQYAVILALCAILTYSLPTVQAAIMGGGL